MTGTGARMGDDLRAYRGALRHSLGYHQIYLAADEPWGVRAKWYAYDLMMTVLLFVVAPVAPVALCGYAVWKLFW